VSDSYLKRPYSIYVLGAGFSQPAGVPLADELWREVYRRGSLLSGRMAQFREDLEAFIRFKADCDGQRLSPVTVNFEEFLGFLDVEFYLGLRGSDTWSQDGNEAQVVAKTLIAQVLAERTPQSVDLPQLYLHFARRLVPGDTVLTFNYDVLLERALEAASVPFRLFPKRFSRIYSGGAEVDRSDDREVVVLKMHGSIDWFDRADYAERVAEWERRGIADAPRDPVFNGQRRLTTVPLVDGPRYEDDPLRQMHRLIDCERLYADPPWFLSVPMMINPSTMKVIFSDQLGEFWRGLGQSGGGSYKLVIIGYSLSPHDDYARQVIYRLARNYEAIHYDKREPKLPIVLIDKPSSEAKRLELMQRYAFLDPKKSRFLLDGFSEEAVEQL
jgi:SIR2-like domain